MLDIHGVRSEVMANYHLPPPEPMVCMGDVATNWRTFTEAFADYSTATELTKKDAEVQAATLKTVMGKDCRQILTRLELTEEERKDTATILAKLKAYFAPTRNILYERYLFHAAEQQPNETVDQYMIRLRHLAGSCNFGNIHDEMLRDRLVLGCRDKGARARLFREKDCNLKKALETLQISEATQEQLKDIGGEEKPISINAVNTEKEKAKPASKKAQHTEKQVCKYCGGKHDAVRTKCPAYGKTCRRCRKPNHFHTVCLKGRQTKPIATMEETELSSSESDELVCAVEHVGTVRHTKKGQYFVPLNFQHKGQDTMVDCQLDTGATCNVMCLKDVCTILHTEMPHLQPETTQLKCYDNSIINTLGQCTLQCRYQNKKHKLTFKVITGNQHPLLSGTTCTELGLITMHSICNVATNSANLIKRYSDVFEGLGCLGDEYHIELDPTVSPVQHVPRRVPVAMKHRLKSKLEELTKQGIITKVQEPTPWISNIVTIMKPGKVRVCIDPRDLNKAIKRPKYQMPTLEEILPTLAQAKIFTVLDAKDGFHQVTRRGQFTFNYLLDPLWTLLLLTYAIWNIIST